MCVCVCLFECKHAWCCNGPFWCLIAFTTTNFENHLNHIRLYIIWTHMNPLPVKPVMQLQRNFCFSPFLSSLRGNAHDQSFTHPHSPLIPYCHLHQVKCSRLKEPQLSSPALNPTARQIQKFKIPLHLPGATPTGLQILTVLRPPSFKCLKRRSYNWHHTHTHTGQKERKDLGSRCRISSR